MKIGNPFPLVLSLFMLVACGKADVQSTCYSNGDHERLSDGRITRICSCVASRVEAQKLTEKETGWVITLLKEKPVKDVPTSEQDRLKEVSKAFWAIKKSCEAIK